MLTLLADRPECLWADGLPFRRQGVSDAEDAEVDRHDRLVHNRQGGSDRRPVIGRDANNLAMSVATALSIVQANIHSGREVGVPIVWILLGASTVLALVVVYIATDDRGATILSGWRKGLEENNAAVGAVLVLVFAVALIGEGISGLSRHTPSVAGGAASDADAQGP